MSSFSPGEITDEQEQYLQWLCDPMREGSKAEAARRIGVHPRTLQYWEAKSSTFKNELRKRYDALNLSPDRTQKILNHLYKLATEGKDNNAVNAAKVLLSYNERLEPSRKPIEDRTVKDLSDEELMAQLEERAAAMKLRVVKNA